MLAATGMPLRRAVGALRLTVGPENTPQEMEAAGKAFEANKTSSDEVATLRAEVAELKQDKVPADQTFGDGGGASPEGRDRASRLEFLNNKEGSFTDAEWKELGVLMANPPAQ